MMIVLVILSVLFFLLTGAQYAITPIERALHQTNKHCISNQTPSELNNTILQLENIVSPQLKLILGHPGLYASGPATSCLDLISEYPEVPPGYYWILGPNNVAVKTYCNFYGFSHKYPAASCSAIKSDIGASSGYYWLQGVNGQIPMMYCDMNKACCNENATGWTLLYNLNMTDSSQNCPSGLYAFQRTTSPLRSCRRINTVGSCTTFNVSSQGLSYSKLCGHVKGYQIGSPDAFQSGVTFGVHGWLFDGIHLQAGPEFVWGFVIAVSTKYDNSRDECPCSNIYNSQNSFIEGTIPSYIKNNYFCESGTNGDWQVNTFFDGDPVWDGQNCPPWSTCCGLNGTPRFCKTLSQSRTDDIQFSVCLNQDSFDEDLSIEMIELYAQ